MESNNQKRDEMNSGKERKPKDLQVADPIWSSEELLDKKGVFYLKDVASKLPLSSPELKQLVHELEEEGKSTWKIMGIRRTWTDWIVKMQKFKSYIKKKKIVQLRSVEDGWDANEMLSKKGQFYLIDVCKKLPITTEQIRYKVRKSKDSLQEFGISRHPKNNAYVVDMETFSRWLSHCWKGDLISKA